MLSKSNPRRFVAATAFVILLLGLVLLFNARAQKPEGLKFVHVSIGRPFEFYSRGFNRPVLAGHVLWKMEGFGIRFFHVSRRTLFASTNKISVIMGFDGDLPARANLGATIITSGEQIPLRVGVQTIENSNQHLIFCTSTTLSTLPRNGVFVISNSVSRQNFYVHKF